MVNVATAIASPKVRASAASPASATTPAADRKAIVGERYKTTMCKNYKLHGECPYESRCMFAHGDHELRTKQMNQADGLRTEEDIRAFRAQQLEAAARPASTSSAKSDVDLASVASETEEPHALYTRFTPASLQPVALAQPASRGSMTTSIVSTALAEADNAKFVSPLAAAMMIGRQCHYDMLAHAKRNLVFPATA